MLGGMDESLPLQAVADLFHVSTKTVRRWMAEQDFPKPFYIGATMFFRAWEVQLWHRKKQEVTEPPPKGGKKGGTNRDNPGQTGTG